jgi:hypothetical protein
MKPQIVPELPPSSAGPPYESIERSSQLAVETAHKTIAFLSMQAYLTADEVKSLAECARILGAAKEMRIKEMIAEKRYKGAKSG